ncbi:YciI family protein [Cellulomonas cellasea]|uniref:YCII-related domain-containing protein n=1 Tax=Cellulomonas cellasea TaxID=43670 RepID=A0A7W4UGE1_9CELL|nr:YciI family protein [Cellulomonas cellasea]MBB2923314.1 hypothetical protein [Cellulomonas cellasea]
MRFLVLLYEDERAWAGLDADGRAEVFRQHDAFSAAVAAHGCTIAGGEGLASVDAATTIRRHGDDVTVTDGPFAETAEQLGGFYLIDAPDLDVVSELVRLLPEYTIEIRPTIEV